jgi:ubiquinone biosynthesis protein
VRDAPPSLHDVYIDELLDLVDAVSPTPFAELEPIVREDIGLDAFVRIDREPIATASIAQIHGALLRDGRRRRPLHDLEDHPHTGRAVGE